MQIGSLTITGCCLGDYCPVQGLGIHPQEALEVLALERAMDQIGGQWIPQEGLSLCLSDPIARQSQLPEQLASECL